MAYLDQSRIRWALIGLIGLTGGCQFFGGSSTPDTKSAYPSTPPNVATNSTAGSTGTSPAPATISQTSAVKVPADAQQLSSGEYPPPAFSAPKVPGVIMVVDMDGDPGVAVATTAVDGKNSDKQMSITDVANMSISLNKLHKYRIVFVPDKAP